MLTRLLARSCGNFGCKESEDQTVLISGPDRPVFTEEACTRALFSAETAGAIKQTRRKLLESDRHLPQRTFQVLHHAIDKTSAS